MLTKLQQGVFVTGTGTGVGKTFVTAAWVRELRRRGSSALALKPVACGGREDAEEFAAANGGALTLDQINPLSLSAALSPYAACKVAGQAFDFCSLHDGVEAVMARFPGPFLVEGVGGWLVPLTVNYLVRDWARELALPVVMVAPAGLGMLNHALLTIESVRAADCQLAGVIVNHRPADAQDLSSAMNAALLAELGKVPVFEFHAPEDLRKMPEWMLV